MLVGICTIDLIVVDSNSLKRKRQILKSIKDRLRQKYNVSVAEIDHHDLWQKATLGIACVGKERNNVNSVLDRMINSLQRNNSIELLDYSIDFL